MRASQKSISPGSKQKKSHRRVADYGFVVAFLILIIIAATLTDVFFTQRNLSNLFRQIVTNGLLSFGMLIVILSGGIDLSIGPIVALTGIMAAGLCWVLRARRLVVSQEHSVPPSFGIGEAF